MPEPTTRTVAVDADALRQVLLALTGAGSAYRVRELQATRSLHKLGHQNPIDTLIEQYNAAVLQEKAHG